MLALLGHGMENVGIGTGPDASRLAQAESAGIGASGLAARPGGKR